MSKTKNQANLVQELPGWDLSVAFYSSMEDPQIEADKKR